MVAMDGTSLVDQNYCGNFVDSLMICSVGVMYNVHYTCTSCYNMITESSRSNTDGRRVLNRSKNIAPTWLILVFSIYLRVYMTI